MKRIIHKKSSFLFLLPAVLFLLSSCVNVEESYHFHNDGSGSASISIDVADVMDMMNSLGTRLDSLADDNETLSSDELFSENESVKLLKEIDGISNVESLNDVNKQVIGFSFDFENINALNEAKKAEKLSEELKATGIEGGTAESDQFIMKRKKLLRVVETGKANDSPEEMSQDDKDMLTMMKSFMEGYTYKVTYTFDRRVKRVKSDHASKSGNTVVWEVPLFSMLDDQQALTADILIRLKRK